ncbi:MAG: RNA methyltransferase [Deltaproteobacteria bacterium]|nr:RNA methyltransferase [Deltaproteobacteria bacterium]
MTDVYIALIHYPVYNKRREVIAAALTTIDIHDLARLTRTYGLKGFFLVTPLEDQMRVAEEMLEHWCCGWGSEYNKARAEALCLVYLAGELNEVKEKRRERSGSYPVIAATTAADGPGRVRFSEMGPCLQGERPLLIIFGTAWGLANEVLADSDFVLEPVKGPTNYNHLSIRSAAGIILDRLFGSR